MDVRSKVNDERTSLVSQHAKPFKKIGEQRFDFNTAWIIFKCQCGSGVLALPFAIATGGWTAIFILLFTGATALFTENILCDLLFENGVLTRSSVYEISVDALRNEPFLRWLACFSQVVDLMGACVSYIVLGGLLLDSIFPSYPYFPGILVFGVATNILVFLLTSTETLGKASLLGNLNVLVMFIIIAVYAALSIFEWGEHLEELSFFTSDTPLSFGICLFTFACHVAVPAYVAKMKYPREFRRTLNVSFSSGIWTQTLFGIFGFLAFGSATLEAVNLNIHAVALRNIISIAIGLDKLFLYPVLFEIAYEQGLVMWPQLNRGMATKFMFVISVFIVSYGVPNFAYINSLVGAVTSTMNVFIFPPLYLLRLRPEVTSWTRLLCYFIVFVGVTGSILGVFAVVTKSI